MLISVARLMGVEQHEVIAVNCMSRVNLLMMISGFRIPASGLDLCWDVGFCFRVPRRRLRIIVNLVEITRLKSVQ